MSELAQKVILAIVTAVITGFGTYYAAKPKNKRDDFQTLIDTWKEDNQRLREEVNELSTRMEEIEEKYMTQKERADTLQNQLILMESAHHDLPFPQWLKDTNGIMLSLNTAYEDMFLKPLGKTKHDYIGGTDEEVWGSEIARKFRENDINARQKKGYWIGIEPIWLKNSDISQRWRILKYTRYVGNVCIGVAGIAIPVTDET